MVGTVLGHYELIDKLGEGGMGVVYRARDVELGRLVAIKLLLTDVLDDDSRRRRFHHEARAASSLNHPNIVTIYDIAHDRGTDFIVMEYVEGTPLRDLIGTQVSHKDIASWALQIASALAAAHSSRIIHRDIKPANILITREGAVKVLDFGLAKLAVRTSVESDSTLTALERTEVTERGTVLGTASYMSPEQAEGKALDGRSDVFSLGVVLYELLSGRRPFEGDSSLAVLTAILRDDPAPVETAAAELTRIVRRALEKNREERYQSASEIERDLATYIESLSVPHTMATRPGGWLKRPRVAIPALIAIAALAATIIWLQQRGGRARWAREQAIPQIARFVDEGRYSAAFDLAVEAEKHIPGDHELARLWPDFSFTPPVDTEPAGAALYIREYGVPNAAWRFVGTSPVRNVRLPAGFFRWRAEKEGYDISYGVAGSDWTVINFKLDASMPVPSDMVQVPSANVNLSIRSVGTLGPVAVGRYYIDQHEVTNRAFKKFVDGGGYQKKEYWTQPFRKAGRTLSWEEAMVEFRDATGRPGPAIWEAGTYGEGEDDMPVGGVSWYEAAAYARFAGKDLPTIYHWFRAAEPRAAAYIADSGAFGAKGPARIDAHRAVGPFGTSDMAGNVKEWCWTETGDGQRFILGGGWDDSSYAYTNPEALPPFDRSATNGFRCVRYAAPVVDALLAPRRREFRDYTREKPVSDDAFRLVRSFYSAPRGELEARMESVDETAPYWRKEKVSYRAAYGRDRVVAYLFVPKNATPPFQTLVYFPAAGRPLVEPSSARLDGMTSIDFILRSGRAVLYPIYYGMYERRLPGGYDLSGTPREVLIHQFQDLSRSIDYLQSRSDIDGDRLGYVGSSLGARVGIIMMSMEDRLRTGVLLGGGFSLVSKPVETDEFTFASRVRTPVLMVNGRHDFTFPVEVSQKQLFRWLGTPPEHKRHVILETAHSLWPQRSEVIREVLNWLDKYLGPVRK